MRVVAGTYGGRRLKAPRGRVARPTQDRVKESMFSMLDSLGVLDGAAVVDLFAGSGALGIEALSRGARSAVFVERDRACAATLGDNLASLGWNPHPGRPHSPPSLSGGGRGVGGDFPHEVTVVCSSVETFLAGPPARSMPFDVAFADPPYSFEGWEGIFGRLEARWVVAESSSPIEPGGSWKVMKSKHYGTTVVTLAHRRDRDEGFS